MTINKKVLQIVRFKTEFHYNKDWNSAILFSNTLILPFKTEFHYNKDWNSFAISPTISFKLALRPNSITTRIETIHFGKGQNIEGVFKTEFHYNKDWNGISWKLVVFFRSSLRPNSITTRIETSYYIYRTFFINHSLRPNSITTRIETCRPFLYWRQNPLL